LDIKDWLKRRLEYGKKARARDQERLATGYEVDADIPYYAKAIEECLIDLLDRIETIEKLYVPAPEEKRTPADMHVTSRIKLG
jgi:hypothetical protein